MRIWIFSDLHLELAPLGKPLQVPDANICVVAGDLCRGIDTGIRWLAKHVAPAMPCIYVAGNHEHYRGSVKEGLEAGRAAAKDSPGVYFLENDAVTIAETRFIGATLWTDFRIQGPPEPAMEQARKRMNDYKNIAWQKKPWCRFLPFHAFRMHQDSRIYIEEELRQSLGRTVVITHHLPHPRSLPQASSEDGLDPAYGSDLSGIIEGCGPSLWVHGHLHASCDYVVSNTRIVSNPRGYGDENRSFDSRLVISLPED